MARHRSDDRRRGSSARGGASLGREPAALHNAGAWSRAFTACAAGLAGAGVLAVGEWLALLGVDRFADNDAAPHAVVAYGFWLAVGLLALLGAGNAVAAYRLRRDGSAVPPAEADPMTVPSRSPTPTGSPPEHPSP
jgi:hypothetical protein